jgi:hypothetical protein
MNKKTESSINIVKESLVFDDKLKTHQYCDLRKTNDSIKSNLQTLMLLSGNSRNDVEILNLCEKLHTINNSIVVKLETASMSGSNMNINKNILLFFYKEGCEPSLLFASEWKKLEDIVGARTKMLSVNCSKEKYSDICNKFGVYQYPTVKFISDGETRDYFGEMTANKIKEEFFS